METGGEDKIGEGEGKRSGDDKQENMNRWKRIGYGKKWVV